MLSCGNLKLLFFSDNYLKSHCCLCGDGPFDVCVLSQESVLPTQRRSHSFTRQTFIQWYTACKAVVWWYYSSVSVFYELISRYFFQPFFLLIICFENIAGKWIMENVITWSWHEWKVRMKTTWNLRFVF